MVQFGRNWRLRFAVQVKRRLRAASPSIHTGNQYKHPMAEMHTVALAPGLQDQCFWQDAANRFNLHLLAPLTDAVEA
jgi:hypothetical protein